MKDFPYKHLSVLLMPTDFCNMNCVYCFHSRKTHTKNKVMSLETLRRIFSVTIPYYEEVHFIWHGGEPVSMGKEFYQTALQMQQEINTHNAKIENSIQSNLTLLDEDFVRFLLDHHFHIGGSFDGTRNDLTRHNTEKILAGRQLVLDCGGQVGFICVVQSNNIDHLIEDYHWFQSKGINYTLNPYMAVPPYEDDPLFVPAPHYIQRVCELFDYWAADTQCKIRISYFHDFIDYILFGFKSLCCYNSCLGKHIGIHYDGQIYNCNRDFPAEYSFGNVYDYTDIHQCFESPGFQALAKKAVERRYHCKENCSIFPFCAGGCNSSAYMGGDLTRGNPVTCQILQAVYQHIAQTLEQWKHRSPDECKQALNPALWKRILKYQDANKSV